MATGSPMTIEEYLTYDDGTDTRYELVDGVLVEMGAESTLNTQIVLFLVVTFLQMGVLASRKLFKYRPTVGFGFAQPTPR